ncbi:hypothetical protein PHISP_07388 [Aspergillus sp. HF37]|nr:hypothetical protein PHISP_07388 [Aspergillus sp. HF37]
MLPPTYSPSPTTQFPPPQTNLPTTPRPLPAFEPEPAAVPISESQNPDAIALRSAISILQLQKQQSLRDIQALEKMKGAAAADPEGFARELAAGKLSAKDAEGLVNVHAADEGAEGVGPEEKFGKVPAPQNVVRMPPVNWAKYQIIGEPLEKIHEEERRRPSAGEPRRDDHTQRPPEHVLASPYRPLADRLDTTKAKDGSASSKGKKS